MSRENPKGLSDAELVDKCQHELPYRVDAFTELVERYGDRVLNKCMAMLGNSEDAQDACQSVFMRVFSCIKNFERRSSLSTWIYAITVNCCLKEIERRNRKPWYWLTEDFSAAAEVAREEEDILTILSRRESSERLKDTCKRLLGDLGRASEEILKLRFIDELDYQSIAERLQISLSAVKMRLKRARKQFKMRFRELENKQS